MAISISTPTFSVEDFISGLALSDEDTSFVFENVEFTFQAAVAQLTHTGGDNTVISIPCKLSDAKAVAIGKAGTLTRLAIRERVMVAIDSFKTGNLGAAAALDDAADKASKKAAALLLGEDAPPTGFASFVAKATAKEPGDALFHQGGVVTGKMKAPAGAPDLQSVPKAKPVLIEEGTLDINAGTIATPHGTMTVQEAQEKFGKAATFGALYGGNPSKLIIPGETPAAVSAMDLLPKKAPKAVASVLNPGPAPAPAPAPKPASSPSSACTPAEMDALAPVALKYATRMYQPVTASSQGSRYFVVALRPDLKVAARYRNNSLSIRVEGEVEALKNSISIAGFDLGSTGKGYASIHFHELTPLLATRALAAVIAGLDLEWQTPAPHLQRIKGKGA